MNAKPGKLSLQLALTLPFVLLTALAMGLSGYLALGSGRQAVDEAIGHLHREIANRITSQLHAFLSVPSQINRLNAEAIGQGGLPATDTQALERHFAKQIDVLESVSSVSFGNVQGGLVNSGREPATDARYVIGTAGFAAGVLEKHAIDGQGNRTALLASVADFDARSRPWYTATVERGSACWSPVYVLATGQDMAIAASAPVTGANSELLGVVAVDVFLSQIGHFLKTLDLGAHGQCFIVERSGLLVASTADEKPFAKGPEGMVGQRLPARLSQSEAIRVATVLAMGSAANATDGSATTRFRVDGQRHFLKSAAFQDGRGVDWIIGIVIAESDFLAPIDLSEGYTVVLGVLAFSLTVGLGLAAAHRVALPLLNLHAATRSMEENRWPDPVPQDSRIAELADLSRAFNDMTFRLRETMERLARKIEDHDRAEAGLQASEAHFRLLFEGNQDAMFLHLIDAQGRPGRFIQVNDAACQRLGYSREQLLAMTPLDIAGPQMAERQDQIATQLKAHGTVLFEGIHLTRDGRHIPIESNIRRMTIAGRDVVLSTSRDIGERKRLEQTLLEGERNFRAFVESIGEMIMVTGLDGRMVYANPALARSLGYHPARLIGMGVTNLHPDDRRQEAQTIFAEIVRGIRTVCPLPLVTRTGDQIPVETRVWRGRWNGADCILGLSQDLRQEQEALQMFDRMFRHNPVPMALSSDLPDRCFLDVNDAFLSTLGYAREEVIGQRTSAPGLFLACDTHEALANRLHRHGRFADVELEVRCKDGSVRSGLFSGERIESHGKTYFLTVMVDITGLRHTQELLRSSEDRWRFALEGAGDGVWDWNAATNEVFFSQQWKGMLGYAADEIGNTLAEWDQRVHPDDRNQVYAEIEKHFSGQAPVYVSEHRIKCKNGTYKWILDRGKVIHWLADGKPLRVIGTHTDIDARKQAEAERRQLEQQLQQAQKAESLGRMAGAVAHHFNNQLAVVQGNLELAMEETMDNAGLRGYLAEAMSAGQRAAEVSGLMLTYLGQTPGRREPLDLSELCRQHLRQLNRPLTGDVLIESNLMDPGPVVQFNRQLFRQVLFHLVKNGLEAVAEGPGRVTLSTSIAEAADIPSTGIVPVGWKAESARYACLEVADTGPGIATGDIYNIFDPFFSTKFTGRGLGLPVVLGTIKACNGAVGVQSGKTHGTFFRVYLPLAGASVAKPPPEFVPVAMAGAGRTVLLVEDQDMVRKMSETMLQRLGYSVIAAENGPKAIELFDRHREEIRCVITDLTMPDMDGWQLIAALRRRATGIPVILASGNNEAEALGRDEAEQVQAFLQKPYSMDQLKTALAGLSGLEPTAGR